MTHYDDAAEPGNFKEDGEVRTNWKTIIFVVGMAASAGMFYFKVLDHDRRLDKIEVRLESIQEIATEIRGELRRRP